MSEPMGKVTVGATYKFRRSAGCLYRVECLAYDPVHRRDVVVYVGLTGSDYGYYFVASPWDFTTKFDLIEDEKEEAPTKVAGVYAKGSGV